MKTFTITYDEVRAHVESLPEGASVGECGDAHTCVVAGAIATKYPKFASVAVWPGANVDGPSMYGVGKRGKVYPVGSADGLRLNHLAERFDALGAYGTKATREEVLPLFE